MNCRKNSKIRKRRILGVWGIALIVCLTVVGLTVGAADGTAVNLRIEGQTQTLFDGEVTVGDCVARDAEGAEHNLSGVALCGLMVAAETNQFEVGLQDFGFGLFIASIGQDVTPADWSKSWSFWINDTPATVGADAYQVVGGDQLFLAFSGYPTVPLRVTAPEKVVAGEQFEVEVSKRVGVYDANYNWQGTWEPAPEASLWISDAAVTIDVAGRATVLNNDPGVVTVWAEGEGLVRSARSQIEIREVEEETGQPSVSPSPSATSEISPAASITPSISPTLEPTPAVSPSPLQQSEAWPEDERKGTAKLALDYLRKQQGADGKIEGDLVTAWSVIAFGADGQRPEAVVKEGKNLWEGLAGAKLASATDVERQILAVRAGGGDPRDWQGRDLVQELRGYVKNGQIGEQSIINDDIFGLLAWLAVEEDTAAAEAAIAVKGVIAGQESSGGWGSADLTAAAIQGLREYGLRGGGVKTGSAVDNGRLYLRSHQDQYGGWGENSASTAWGIQAIVSLGENPSGWVNSSGKNPWGALRRYQNKNGGFGWRSSEDVSAFMTAYAVPALLEKAWPVTNNFFRVDDNQQDEQEVISAGAIAPSPSAASVAITSPLVAGARAKMEVAATVTQASSEAGMNQSVVGEGAGQTVSIDDSSSLIKPERRDWRFVLSLFSLANMGIGVTVARLLMKI